MTKASWLNEPSLYGLPRTCGGWDVPANEVVIVVVVVYTHHHIFIILIIFLLYIIIINNTLTLSLFIIIHCCDGDDDDYNGECNLHRVYNGRQYHITGNSKCSGDSDRRLLLKAFLLASFVVTPPTKLLLCCYNQYVSHGSI